MKRTLFASLAAVPALLLAALVVPAAAAAAGPVTTAASCSGTTSVTCNLWAEPGTLALPGPTAVPAWGYATTAGGSPTIPGPAIVVEQGATVTVNLVNDLPQATSLVFEGVQAAPDLASVAASGGSHAYTFTAGTPGTYLYEAGILPGSEYQASMGLHGVLIVRPTGQPGQAYAGAETAFADEAVVVVSEIDPALNTSASPQSFDLRAFAPRWFLVNGKAYTTAAAASIPVTSGNALLLRYANAGNLHHSLGVLGLHQRVLAANGSELPAQRTMVAETIAPGQTADVLVSLPATASASTLYPVYDASLLLNNSTASGIGGMLAFLDAAGTAGGGDTVGPVTSAVSFTPSTGDLAASVSDASTGNATVAAAEYFIDTPGAGGSGAAMAGAFASPTEAVTATVPAAVVAGLASGTHSVYVHGQDALGNWGAFASSTFVIDLAGPTTSALTLAPNPTGGSAGVAIAGTASDATSGNANVTAAEYTIDGGAPSPMTLNKVAPTVSLTATIPASTVAGLGEGTHAIAVRSQDALLNWGAPASITLTVDKTGPATSAITANPPANNGRTGQSSGNPSVRVSASVSDAATGNLKVAGAEGFIDTVGAPGTGFPFTATDGVFSTATEAVYADIPLSTINLLADGSHTLVVRGRDAVGNWGTTASITYLVDRAAPTFTGITLAAVNPTLGGGITLSVNGAVDPLVAGLGSGVTGGEYWIDVAAPTPGAGTPFSGVGPVTIATTIATGNHSVGVRIRDAAGNWSATTASGSVATTAVAIFSNGFDAGGAPWGWSSRSTNSTTRLNVTTATVLSGTRSLQAQGNNTNFVQFNFGTTANPAWPTYDARFQFNPNNNASTGQDILAAATSNTFGTQVFHVRYRRNGAQPQVQIQVGATANATWTNVTNNATNTIEVVWQAVGSAGAAPGTLTLTVNGTLAQTLATTSTSSVGAVRLGSVTSGGSATLELFDAFASKRSVSPLFGP